MFSRLLNRFRFNSSRHYLEDFCRRAGSSISASALVLDAGAGEAPYKKFFSHAQYESADFCAVDKPYYNELTYVCSLESIPVEDERYDDVILTQVLEHLPDPTGVLKELNRVMKPGGKLWLTVPLFYPEHEQPYDFFRYTRFGLSMLCEKTGFKIEKIEWLEGYYGTVAFQLETAAKYLPCYPRRDSGVLGWLRMPVLFLVKTCMMVLSLWFSRLDVKEKVTDKGHCKNYTLVATKAIQVSTG